MARLVVEGTASSARPNQRHAPSNSVYPGAVWIVHGRWRLRNLLLVSIAPAWGLPPVPVGLAGAFAFWRIGPRPMDLLYTSAAMVIAQAVIVVPLIRTLAVIALRTSDQTQPMLLGR